MKGRPLGLTPAPSRSENVTCCVPGCGVSMRKDNLRSRHYQILVNYDSEGRPLSDSDPLFETLTTEQKTHTKYFEDQNISESSETPFLLKKAVSADINPFSLAKKRRIDERTTDAVASPAGRAAANIDATTNVLNTSHSDEGTERLNDKEVEDEETDVDNEIDENQNISRGTVQHTVDGVIRQHDLPVRDAGGDDANNNISNVEKIVSGIMGQLSGKLGISGSNQPDLASQIAKKVVDNLKKEKQKEMSEEEANWMETDEDFICNDCFTESNRSDVHHD